MGTITINGKNIKSININGKLIHKLNIGGKVLNLGPVEPNTYNGSFVSSGDVQKFKAISEDVPASYFRDEPFLLGIHLPRVLHVGENAFYYPHLTSISLPHVQTIGNRAFYNSYAGNINFPECTQIGESAFQYSPATSINLPKVQTVGSSAFQSVVNRKTTNITINKKFDTVLEKARIFGNGNWELITFHWTNDDGTPYVPPANSFTGSFSRPAKEQEFLASGTNIHNYTFYNEPRLTGISLHGVISIGGRSFGSSPLTLIEVPIATTIGDLAFEHVVNAPSTHVTMLNMFNTHIEKNRIFGSGHWDQITFTWV